ncbi:response regulator [Pseudoalteromonas sp. SSM20]|uniref:response regulator n=1 Tax=Pseudoalteromonas sp. SSM20 TaxID=3139394 RepID=UPI003BA94E5D
MSQISENSLKDKSILIIDDQKSFQKLLKGMLVQLGANNISFYDSGEAALNKIEKDSVDIVFIDYNLGQGRNGKQFLEELKYLNKLSRHSISILVTGESTRSVVLSVLEIEPDDYLIKPFSSGMLKTRLNKLSAKKKLFYHANQAIEDGQLALAAEQYLEISKKGARNAQFCFKRACQVYFDLGENQKAFDLLNSVLESARPTWALTYLAQACFYLTKYDQAIRICDELLGQNRFNIDALDIKALCLNQLNQGKESLFLIEQSCNISPHSFARQRTFAEIAQANNDLDALVKAQNTLLAMSKGTAFAHIDYQFNYIRAMFSQLNNANSKHEKSELTSQIKSSLRQAQSDPTVVEEPILFNEFNTFCEARLSVSEGEYLTAKKIIAPLTAEQSLSHSILPDSIMTLFDLGEFDDANAQLEKYQSSKQSNSQVLAQLHSRNDDLASKQSEFQQHNTKGIELYKQGNFQDAIVQFEMALKHAPMNTGSALNLLQALLQLLPRASQAADVILEKCQSNFVLVDGMALPPQHAKRLEDLKFEYNKLAKLYYQES